MAELEEQLSAHEFVEWAAFEAAEARHRERAHQKAQRDAQRAHRAKRRR